MPVFDAAATVARAIDSIRAQTFSRWELLVVDDGSSDETTRIVAAMAGREPRVRLIRRPREGIVAALNAGIGAAKGEFVARMDADDESFPERLAAQADFLSSDENRAVGLVGCLVEFGGDRSASTGFALHVDWMNSLVNAGDVALSRFIESPLAHPSVMFRRGVWRAHGGYRAGDFPEDYDLWLRWLEAGVAMTKIPRVLLRWNDRPKRLSRTDPRYAPEAFFRLKAAYVAREVERLRQARGRPFPAVWIWGAGRPTRKRAALLERYGVEIIGYIDVDRKKVTPAIGGVGRPVRGYEDLPPPGEMLVLGYVSSRGAREFIREQLGVRGYVEGRDFLMCA